jgi:tRNA dimethylallyltransferase
LPEPLVALFGPTGVGKTAVAIALAERLRARGEDPVAISADALQVYDGLGLLTGAASAAEQERLEHRLVGFVAPTETFSVGAYMPLAHAEIDAALAAGRRPIVVGGTGLYLRAALTRLSLPPAPPPALRARLEERVRVEGAQALHAELAAVAPAAAEQIRPGDGTRVVRALELIEMGEEPATDGGELWTADTRRPTLLCGLVMERDELYARIDARVEAIVAAGAAHEVAEADVAGASRTARSALGFEQLLSGDVEGMKRRTRNYAKRQLTWMRKLPGVSFVDMTGRDPDDAATQIEGHLPPEG